MKESNDPNFDKVFWFIVGLCIFGAGLTVFLIVYLPPEASLRVADNAMIFWLTTAVGGGIGYLIGSSVKTGAKQQPEPLNDDK